MMANGIKHDPSKRFCCKVDHWTITRLIHLHSENIKQSATPHLVKGNMQISNFVSYKIMYDGNK